MLARVPWVRLPPVRARPKKLNRGRRAHIVRVVAGILAMAEPTKFTFEATCRHALRSRLCLAGWRWDDADVAAADIVSDALRSIGAQRPTWKEGQPEWTQDGHSPIERTACVRCKNRLPEGHKKFCCQLCASAHHGRLVFLQSLEDGAAYDAVVQKVTFWRNTR